MVSMAAFPKHRSKMNRALSSGDAFDRRAFRATYLALRMVDAHSVHCARKGDKRRADPEVRSGSFSAYPFRIVDTQTILDVHVNSFSQGRAATQPVTLQFWRLRGRDVRSNDAGAPRIRRVNHADAQIGSRLDGGLRVGRRR
jgi:hypothetical protein